MAHVIKKMGGSYRLLTPDGKSVLAAGNKKGNEPADGGGHKTYEAALAQLQAIEAHKHAHGGY